METHISEDKEKEQLGRKFVLHFIRHGSAAYTGSDDRDGYLTERGCEQAKGVAKEIYEELPAGAVVEFVSSDRVRARQTAETIQEELCNLEDESNKDLIFHGYDVKTFNHIGLSGELTEEYLNLIDEKKSPVHTWLSNPSPSSAESERGFQDFLGHLSHFAQRLPINGPDIHVIAVSHTGPSEVFVGRLLNNPEIGSLANCEQFTIELPVTKDQVVVNYKGQRKEIIL
ncbi:MAG: histidine phosphatase family protein [Candidatus Daviesbacteria bacterium]